MIFYLIFIILLVVIIFIFSSPQLSPIPYFPSQKIDLPKIIKALNLKNNQTVFDLGAGDGVVIFEAAQSSFNNKLNTKFVAVEINPILILVLFFRRLFHHNRKNIKIIFDDIFKMNLDVIARSRDPSLSLRASAKQSHNDSSGQAPQSRKGIAALPLVARNDIVVYLYISPWYLEKTISNIKNQTLRFGGQISKFSVVSYMYPIKSFKNKEKIIQGKNRIFTYN